MVQHRPRPWAAGPPARAHLRTYENAGARTRRSSRQSAGPSPPPAAATAHIAASCIRAAPLDPRGLVWSCKICARRTRAEGVKGGRRSRAVAVTRRWVVCAAKQGLQQHRELQRTLQRTWSPAERYSASRVAPVARRHSEGVRCSRGERFSVRGHRIAPVAHGRPPLENREESDRAAMHALTATAPRRRNCRFTASSRFLNGKKGRAI